jgi:hypothetical protein
MIESNFLGGKGGLPMDALDGGIELFECGSEGPWKGIAVGGEGRRVPTEDPEIELAVEEGHAQTIGRDMVAMRAGLSLDEAAEAETSEVVGHLRGRIRSTEECGDARAQIAVSKARGQTHLTLPRVRAVVTESPDRALCHDAAPLPEVDAQAQRSRVTKLTK